MNRSESLAKFAPAFVKAQAEIKNPYKANRNTGISGATYATLEDTLDEYVRPVLTKYGLSVLQTVCNDDNGNVGVSTMILHESGEYIQSDYVYCPLDIKTSANGNRVITLAQGTGVNITYLRRYSLNAILGIQGDKDTDGSYTRDDEKPTPAVPQSAPQSAKTKEAKKSHYTVVKELIAGKDIDVAAICEKMFGGPVKVNDLSDAQFELLCMRLRDETAG